MGDNYEDHEYPDPDDTPRFAWAGAKALTASFKDVDDYVNDHDMITPDEFPPDEDFQDGSPFFDPDQQIDPNGENIDPGFLYQDDSNEYIQIITKLLLQVLS